MPLGKKCSPAIETWQVAGLDITLATPRKVSFDSHHECRNINWSRNDSPIPPIGVAFDNSEKTDVLLLENSN